MSKKLQVFISSTYTDLLPERQAAVQAVLLAGHIPAGMELFSAGDATQLQVIKEWIEESDVYLLILGARYGSLEPLSKTGYTEIEYDYAAKLGKPHFALVLDDAAIQAKRALGLVSKNDEEMTHRLDSFRSKALGKTSRICADAKDITIFVLQSLNEIARRPGLSGWVRPSDQPEIAPLLSRIEALSAENERLREAQHGAQANSLPNLASFSDSYSLLVNYKERGFRSTSAKPILATWGDLFGRVGIKLLEPVNDATLNAKLARELTGYSFEYAENVVIQENDWETIKAQFLALGLVKLEYLPTVSKSMAQFWSLTEYGKQMALALRTVKAPSGV